MTDGVQGSFAGVSLDQLKHVVPCDTGKTVFGCVNLVTTCYVCDVHD